MNDIFINGIYGADHIHMVAEYIQFNSENVCNGSLQEFLYGLNASFKGNIYEGYLIIINDTHQYRLKVNDYILRINGSDRLLIVEDDIMLSNGMKK